MAVSPVQKVLLTGLTSERESLLATLQDFGGAQVDDWSTEQSGSVVGGEGSALYELARVQFALNLLERFDTRKKPFKEKLLGGKLFLKKSAYEQIVNEFPYEPVIARLEKLEEDLNRQESMMERTKTNTELLAPWAELQVPGDGVETKEARQLIVELPSEQLPLFSRAVEKQLPVAVEVVWTDERTIGALLTYRKGAGDALRRLLTEHEGQSVALPEGSERPAVAIERLQKESADAQKKKDSVIAQIKKELEQTEQLKVIHDHLAGHAGQEGVGMKGHHTQKTVSFICWVEKRNRKNLETALANQGLTTHVQQLTPDTDEALPVPLRNGKWIKPFESVTGIYGVPQSSEPDPTPFLAGFFIIFFGLALTDAGYGIFLALLSAIAIKVLKIPPEGQRLFRLFIFGGVITFVLGALFGGWFGITLTDLPMGIGNALAQIQLINPVEDPITVLLLTFALGIIQILVGLGIDFWWKTKHGKRMDALLDDGVWMFFIGAILYWTLATTGLLPGAAIGQWVVVAGAGLLVLTQGRKAKNIVLKILGGVMSLYNLVGYFSDVLSYSRLLALGLATGIIASVVNLVAMLAKDMLPVVGWVVAIAIIIGGHVFNLAINTLGAFIHSGRLQFVEFFPKFMEGGGRRFTPFATERKFIRILQPVTTHERN